MIFRPGVFFSSEKAGVLLLLPSLCHGLCLRGVPVSATRRSADGFALQVMVGLCLVWGVQQVMIMGGGRYRASDAGGRTFRYVGVAGRVADLLEGRLEPGGDDLARWPVGRCLVRPEFFFISEGLQLTTAAHMSVFLTPRRSSPHWVCTGCRPVSVCDPCNGWGLSWPLSGLPSRLPAECPGTTFDYRMLMGDALGVLAGAAWGATTVVVRASRCRKRR